MMQRIGILGGGQLGKMLYIAGAKMDMDLTIMDKSQYHPGARVCPRFVAGNFEEYKDVIRFAETLDLITIEIEKVNVDALYELEKRGVKVFPEPRVIAIIQDKGLQKRYYQENNLPTGGFEIYQSKEELIGDIESGKRSFPFVQKLRKDGYDGRGVHVTRNRKDLDGGFEHNFLVEELIEIEKELAVIACRAQDGNIAIYDPVEMVFHPTANLLLYQQAPARLNPEKIEEAKALAKKTIEAFKMTGLLAIEMFLCKDGRILINEVAPRPHNSGHHTIEAAITSQYENHLRAISGLPMGSTSTSLLSLLMNVLGEEGQSGPVKYIGMDKILALEGVNLHIYGKPETRPFRKMGHINIVGKDPDALYSHYEYISKHFRVISQ